MLRLLSILVLLNILLGSTWVFGVGTYSSMFKLISEKYQLPPRLLEAVCSVESNLRPHVINLNDGGLGNSSFGLCQVSYHTATQLLGMAPTSTCVHEVELGRCPLLIPERNVEYAARYLSYQLVRYQGSIRKAISAYNAGKSIRSNAKYVSRVLKQLHMEMK